MLALTKVNSLLNCYAEVVEFGIEVVDIPPYLGTLLQLLLD